MSNEKRFEKGSPTLSADTEKTKAKDQASEYHAEDVAGIPGKQIVSEQEWKWAKYFPGGYHRKRMIRFKKPKTMYNAINLLAGVAILFYGYDQGVMSQVNLNPNYLTLMGIYPTEGNSRNLAALGGIVAVYYGGTLIGALLGGSLADRAGRLKAIVFACFWSILGAALQTSAQNITWMCCARVITGVGVGTMDAVIPVWSSEVSSHGARGAFLAMEFFLNIFGLALAYWIEYFAFLNPNMAMAWRTPLGLQIVFLLIIIVCVNFFPESPRWLAKMGRVDEAREILLATRDGGNEEVEHELQGILRSVEHEKKNEQDNHYSSMIWPKTEYQRQLSWRVVLTVWLQIMQELVGIGVITVYAVDLFQGASFSVTESKLLAGFNNISYMFSTLFAVFTLDRCGRRSTMVWGAVAMALALLIGGVLDKYAQDGGPNQRSYGAGVAAFTFIYTAIFGATWLTTPWLYPTEIFPTHVRAKGGAWSVVGWSIGNGVVTMITPFLFMALKYGVLLLFMGLNVFVIPFIIYMYPETAGRPLEEMDTFFGVAKSWNVFKASRQIKEAGHRDWRWTKKYDPAAVSNDEEGSSADHDTAVERSERDKTERDEERKRVEREAPAWKRPFMVLKRKGDDAGIM